MRYGGTVVEEATSRQKVGGPSQANRDLTVKNFTNAYLNYFFLQNSSARASTLKVSGSSKIREQKNSHFQSQ